MTDLVTIDPVYVEAANRAHVELIGIESRWQRISAAYAALDALPKEVKAALESHRQCMAAGNRIDRGILGIMRTLSSALDQTDSAYSTDQDPLPAIERLAGIRNPAGPILPSPDLIGEEDFEVSIRAAHQYRLARMRGSKARKFASEVKQVYRYRCAFCGAVYGGVPGIRPGVDAAHILAWSKHDLDVVSNGITLCKIHHWAFDEAVYMPVPDHGGYTLRFTAIAAQFDPVSLSKLGVNGQVIPTEWLPADPKLWPSAKYLAQLYDDLTVAFLD